MNIENELLKEANKALRRDEVPISCIIIKSNKIIAKTHNTKQKKHCCVDHAEIKAIIKAERKLKDWRLDDCEMYVTLEPCKMCKEVIRQSRIKKVYYLLESTFSNEDNKKIEYIKIIKNGEITSKYGKILSDYFKSKR